MASQATRPGTSSLAQRIIGRMRIGDIPIENFPAPNRSPFRDQVPAVIEPHGKPVGTVAYFTGCATNHIFERTGHAAVKVLTRMGRRGPLPRNRGCCGQPLFFHGDMERARSTIPSNIDAMQANIIQPPIQGFRRRRTMALITALSISLDRGPYWCNGYGRP